MDQSANDNLNAAALADDRAAALRLINVSRETLQRLDRFVEMLIDANARTNLISRSSVPHIWTRHIADSLQLLPLAPNAKCWVDLGSGAGFPGLVISCELADASGIAVHLVESIGKKTLFLEQVASALALPVVVHRTRIENFVQNSTIHPDVVTARAVAPLDELLSLAQPLIQRGALGLFHKGQDVEAELTESTKYWNMDMSLVPSVTNPASRIVVVRTLQRRPRT
jgi:16S rRNA (guanine527-N7)-methyltransferase